MGTFRVLIFFLTALGPAICTLAVSAQMPETGTGTLTYYTFTEGADPNQGQSSSNKNPANPLGLFVAPDDFSSQNISPSGDGADNSLSIVVLQAEIYRFRPTILEDIGSAAQWASESWWNSSNIEKRFSEALSDAYIRDGNFSTSLSSPLSARPPSYSLAEEADFRREMAQSLKHYLLVRGIPKFLSAREGTKKIGKKYEQTIHKVQNLATVKVETNSKWLFKSGINPFTLVGWASYSNRIWNFEMNSNLNKKSMDLFVQRSFRSGYRSELRLRPLSHVFIATMNKEFHPALNGYFSTLIPYENSSGILANTMHTIGAKYLF